MFSLQFVIHIIDSFIVLLVILFIIIVFEILLLLIFKLLIIFVLAGIRFIGGSLFSSRGCVILWIRVKILGGCSRILGFRTNVKIRVPLIGGFSIKRRYSWATTVSLKYLLLFSIFLLILISTFISQTEIFLVSSASTDPPLNIHSVFIQLRMTTSVVLLYGSLFHLLAFLFSFSNSKLVPSKLQLPSPHLAFISQSFGYQHTAS